MVVINKSANSKCWRGYGEKGNPPALLVEMYIDTTTMKNSMEIPQETKCRTTMWSSSPTPGHISRQNFHSKIVFHRLSDYRFWRSEHRADKYTWERGFFVFSFFGGWGSPVVYGAPGSGIRSKLQLQPKPRLQQCWIFKPFFQAGDWNCHPSTPIPFSVDSQWEVLHRKALYI